MNFATSRLNFIIVSAVEKRYLQHLIQLTILRYKKLIKTTVILSGIISLAVILVLFFISPIAKRLVQKHDVEYTGREIQLDRIYINPFTGFIHIYGLKVYEANSDSVFFSAGGLSGDVSMQKLFAGTIELSEISVDQPQLTIIQNKKEFNFNDLLKRFSSANKQSKEKSSLRVNLLNLAVNNGRVIYREQSIPVNYSIIKLDIKSNGIMWNADTLQAFFSLNSGIGEGTMKGSAMLNIKTLDYCFATKFKAFDLSVLEQYLKDISKEGGNLQANMDADLTAKGDLKNPENIDLKGLLAVNDMHFGKENSEDYLSFKKLSIDIKRLNPKSKKYLFDSLSVLTPSFLYERYDSLDNIQNMFGKKGSKIAAAKADAEKPNLLFQIADYVKLLAKNFFKSNYEINRIAIYNADLRYSDYSLSEKFDVAANPLFLIADSIKRSNKWVEMSLKTNLKPYGGVSVNLSINPKDSSDFNIDYRVQRVPVTIFNPYLIKYTSYPLRRGTVGLEGSWKVNNGNIKSVNHITVVDPRISTREKQNAVKTLPLKFIMFFIRERGNVIDYEVPITGDLKKPRFSVKDIVQDALINFVIKPPTALYRSEVSSLENEIENAFDFSWTMNSYTFGKEERKFADHLNEHLIKNPAVTINIAASPYSAKEKENIASFEARKLFYLSLNAEIKTLSNSDTLAILQIPVKDKQFIRFLNRHKGNKELYTVQDKCLSLVGKQKTDQLYERLNSQRKEEFLSCFKISGVNKRIRFSSSQDKIPYNGLSYYRIRYNGAWPDELINSYNRMNDLDKKTPRNKFRLQRKKNQKASLGI